ncbi:uncharacterized protein LOC125232865 [Leguminivora glycinivorella]|uniref:uncharacterized protein LOC125232865 n=1 Tax=Leguminivora glycinivorella TaxID=1035111 RepID=UPI00200DFC8E|nr:uncharacterized protein LOC125232865 [Leguminivora glycinivorella]
MAYRSTRNRGRSRQTNQSVPDAEVFQQQLGDILARLHALEDSAPPPSALPSATNGADSHVEPNATEADAANAPDLLHAPGSDLRAPSLPPGSSTSTVGESSTAANDVTDRLIGALTALTKMTGKLDSGMRGPYRVTRVLPHGRYNLRLVGGSYGKTTQAAAEHMVIWRGEWTPESCAAFFDSEEDTTSGTISTDSDAAAATDSPSADASLPGPTTSAAMPPEPNSEESQAVSSTSHHQQSASHTTESSGRPIANNNDVREALMPEPRRPRGRGRPRVRRGRKRR